MKKLNPHLFIYGTLMDIHKEPAASLMKGCPFFSKGKFAGKLHDFGEYPGAILAKAGEGYVYGDIVFMENAQLTLTLLDDYEGFGDDQEQPNLFIRELIAIETDEGQVDCWVYLYNLPVEGARQIISGAY